MTRILSTSRGGATLLVAGGALAGLIAGYGVGRSGPRAAHDPTPGPAGDPASEDRGGPDALLVRPEVGGTRTPARGDLAAELADARAENARLRERLAELEDAAARRAERLAAVEGCRAWLAELSPEAFGDMTAEELLHARELDLSSLPVEDDDLRHLANLDALKTLTLRKTAITDAGLVHLAACAGLESLGLRETAVGDEGMRNVRALPSLTKLDVNMCPVTDAGLAELEGLDLTFLRLNYTRVTDAGLGTIATLRSLERLDLWGTKVTDEGLDQLLGHPALAHLELGGVPVSREWVEAFQAAHPDCYVRSPYGR